MFFIVHLAVLTAVVFFASRYLPTVHVRSAGSALVVALVFSLLNFFLGWAIKAALFIPGLLTLGLLFLILPFVVNLILIWITDKLLHAFRVDNFKSYALLAALITMASWFVRMVLSRH